MNEQGKLTLVAITALWLATFPLMAIYSNFMVWMIPCLMVIVTVSGVAALARRFARGILVQALSMMLALLLFLTLLYPSGGEILRLIPTPATFENFNYLFVAASHDVTTLSVPVMANPNLVFVTVVGVGFLAIVNDLFIVGCRTPSFSGICYLTLYMVPVSVNPTSVSWLWFAAGAAAYLWVLATDHQSTVLRFGHRFTGSGHIVSKRAPSPLAGPGTALTAVLVAATIAIAAILPATTDGILDQVSRGDSSGSDDAVGRVDPWVQLRGELDRPDPIDLAYIETDQEQPPYLRLHVADHLDDSGFRPSDPGDSSGPADEADLHTVMPTAIEPDDEFEAQVTNLGLTDIALPYYGQVSEIDINDNWEFFEDSATIRSEEESLDDVEQYSFSYHTYDYSPDDLRDAFPVHGGSTAAADNIDTPHLPELTTIVDDIVEEEATQYDNVSAIHEYFSPANGFTYDLMTQSGNSSSAILDFLEYQQGFCEQYSAAMAWMVREAGYPARVAIGLTRGTNDGDGWTVDSHNWHAWTEVYFDQFGWVPFDPTPSSGVQNAMNFPWSTDDGDTDNDPDTPDDEPTSDEPTSEDDLSEADVPEPELPENAGGAASSTTSDDGISPWWLAAAGTIVLFLTPAMARILTRQRRLRNGSVNGEAAWKEAMDLLTDFKQRTSPSLTPRQTAAAVTTIAPHSADAMRRLSTAVEHDRYAPQSNAAPAEHLPDAVRQLRQNLREHRPWYRRMWGWLLPRSTRRHTRRWSNRTRQRISDPIERARQLLPWRRSRIGDEPLS